MLTAVANNGSIYMLTIALVFAFNKYYTLLTIILY